MSKRISPDAVIEDAASYIVDNVTKLENGNVVFRLKDLRHESYRDLEMDVRSFTMTEPYT